MAYQEFDGELDAPKYTEFSGELDKPANTVGKSVSDALDVATDLLPDSLGNRVDTLRGRVRPVKPSTVAETITLPDPQLDPELNRQTMLKSSSPDSVMFTAGRGKQKADAMVARGAALETMAKKEGYDSVPALLEGVKDTERRQAFANKNPIAGGMASSAANSLAGLENAPATAADFFNKVIVNPVLNAVGADSMPDVALAPGTQTLKKMGADFSPAIANVPMQKAWDSGVFGEWAVAQMAQNSQSMVMSLAAAFVPPLRVALLPSMGATSAGQSYTEGDDSRIAVAKGMLEAGTEMLPLGIFDKLKALPLSASKSILADAGKRLLAAGGVITAQHVTEAIEEGVNQFSGNVLDKYVQGKDVGLMDDVPKAAVVGGISGSALGVGHVANIASKSTMANSQGALADTEASRALAAALDGGEFAPADFNRAEINPNLTNAQPTERERIESQRPAAQAAIAAAATPDEAVTAFTAATQTHAPETASVDPITLTPSTDLLAKAEADLAQQESLNGTAASVLPTDSAGLDAATVDAGLGVGAGDGAGLQPAVPQGVAGAPVLDAAAGVPAGVADSALNTPSVDEQAVAGVSLPQGGINEQLNGIAESKLAGEPAIGAGVSVDGGEGPVLARANVPNVASFGSADAAADSVLGKGIDDQVEIIKAGNRFLVAPKGSPLTQEQQAEDQRAIARLNQGIAASGETAGVEVYTPAPTDRPEIRRAAGAVNRFATIVNTAFGTRLIPVVGTNGYGVQYAGRTFVDIGALGDGGSAKSTGLDIPSLALHITGHELSHQLELSKDPQDRADHAALAAVVAQYRQPGVLQARTKMEDETSIKFGGPARGTQYAANEIVADVNGAMWRDSKFWARLYEVDNGSTMRRIAYRFMQGITKLISVAKGVDNYDVNTLISHVEVVREAAAQAWASKAMRGKPMSRSTIKAELFSTPPTYARGVIGEVAPNPDKPVAQAWDAQSDNEKTTANRAIAKKLVQQVFDRLGLKGWSLSFSTGTYLGKTNPNFLIDAPDSATPEQIDEAARVIGYVLDQKAMVTFDEDNTTGENLSGFVKLVLPSGMSDGKIAELRKHIQDNAGRAGDDTMRHGALVFGNFTQWDADGGLTDAEFRQKIFEAVDSFDPSVGSIDVMDVQRYESQLIEPGARGQYREGTRYDSKKHQVRPGDSRAVLRSEQGDLLTGLRQWGREYSALRQQWIDASQSGRARSRAGKLADQNRTRADGQGAVEYGRATPNSTQAVGVHFSKERRPVLLSTMHGSGLRGAEAARLNGQPDLAKRLYFYVDTGNGVRPESGVGSVEHQVKLNNLYDANADVLGIIKNTRGHTVNDRSNAWERAVVAAGFDGYLADTGGQQNFAVLVGKHEVAFSRRFKSVEDFAATDNGEADDYAFNIDQTDDELLAKLKDDKTFSKAALQAELQAEAKQAKAPPAVVTLADMQKAGLFPEALYAETLGAVVEDGNELSFEDAAIFSGSAAMNKNRHDELYRVSVPDSWLNNAPKEAGLKFMQQQLVKKRIASAGFDLASAYKKGTVLKLAAQWQKLAGKPGLFKLPDSGKSKPFAEIAADMKAFPDYNLRVMGTDHQFVVFTRKTTGESYQATIQANNDTNFEVCTMELAGSGDLGSRFYAVASEYARLNGKRFMSASTLSGINSARRTEQALSYALKTGDTGVIYPGVQNRVYGYKMPKTQEDHAMNLGRLLLASLRNAVEVDPNIRRLNYQPDSDSFLDAKGNDATAKVEAFLKNPAARAFGMGRTTLARAVLTSQMLSGKFDADGVAGFKTPIAYSRKLGMDGALSEAAGEPGDMNPNFEAWFKDSKVVDAAGNPLVMYHGTYGSRKTADGGFDLLTPSEWAGGVFLSDSTKVASAYADDLGGHVYPVFVRITNPKRIDGSGKSWRTLKLEREVQLAKEEGHDGLLVSNFNDMPQGYKPVRATNVVAFDSTQIKSVFNKGTWSADDERISYARKKPDGSVYDYDAALAVKFERIRRLTHDHPALMTRIDEDADKGVELAKVLRLMAYTGFRVGGDPGLSGKHEAFGATTLKPEHVTVDGDVVHFDFIGKAGVRQQHSINHPKIARDIESRLDQPKLFKATDRGMRKYNDAIIGDKDYKLHDYRTWVATEAARRVVEAIPAPTTPAEFWAAYDLAGKAAAVKIGDTLKVALESYVEPTIFQGFRESAGVPEGSRRSDSKNAAPNAAADAGLDGEVLQPTYARRAGPEELKYQKNYLVPEIDGAFEDGDIARLPGIVFARDGIMRTFPSMPVRIRVGEHQRGEKFNEQYGVQHRVEGRNAEKQYRDYITPDIGQDSAAEVERAARDMALGVLTAKTAYADGSKFKIYVHSPEQNRMTVLSKEQDVNGTSFWSVQTSIPKSRDQMMRSYKAPTTISGIITGRDGTQQPIGNLTGILNKLKEPGSFLTSSESYIIDDDGLLFEGQSTDKVDEAPTVAPKQLARDANGRIILNKNKVAFARKFAQDTQGHNFVLPGETKFSATRRALQDYFLPVLEIQQALLKQGGVIGEAQNVYRAEERMYGRIQETLKDFNQNVFTPMIEGAVASGINPDELALYAYAKHAPERNAHIASIDKRLQDGGSGMTNQEAADIIAAFTAEGKLPALQVAHNDLMAITATTRRTQLEEDLITQQEYDAMEAQYENYIPLRGFADLDEEDQPSGVKRGGRGFNVRGKENMRALGRTSRAGDLIENVAIDYEKAIVRGERNTVGKVFLDLVQNNPDDALWQIDATLTRKSFDRATGKIARNTVIESGPDTIAVKVNGKEVYIKVSDERLLRALRMAYKDDTGAVAAFLNDTVGLYSTLMRNTLTRFNPAFAAVNAVRDFGSGSVAVVDELGFKGQALYMKHYAGATRASWRNERGTQKQDDWGQWFEEYRAAGATTGGYYARSAEEISGDIRDVMLINGAAPKGKLEILKAKGGYKTIKKLGHVLEVLGSTSENAARVAAYRTAREMGKSPAEAASIAKNLTTNFNRKGEWGQVLNTMFVFYNAAVQGTARTLKALKNPKVQGLMAGAAAAGFMMALANAGWGGDDDDGEAYWDKIADFEKERNFIIMLTPGMDVAGASTVGKHGRYIKIPMPYGFNIFPMLGQQLADVYRHSKDETRGLTIGKASVNWLNAIMGSFNPLGGAIDPASGTSWLMAAMPSIGDLGVQLAAGINAFDKPTAPYKSEYDSGLDSENVNPRQAGGIAHKAARLLNKATGGNELEAGFMDVAPGTLENLWRNATGGTGVFLSDVFLNLPSKLLSEDATVTPRDIPILKSFYAPVDELNDASKMYDRRREIMEAVATQKRYDNADMDKTPDKDFEALLSLGKTQARYTKQLSAMRKDEIELALDEKISDKERNLRVKEIKLERAQAITEFNTEFMDAMRAKRDGEFGK